jgi:hypothetical protein
MFPSILFNYTVTLANIIITDLVNDFLAHIRCESLNRTARYSYRAAGMAISSLVIAGGVVWKLLVHDENTTLNISVYPGATTHL